MNSSREPGRWGRIAPKENVDDDSQLSPGWIRELKRRVKESHDPVRYVLVSELSRKFILYYDVSTDTFAMNIPSRGTLFKRREVAESVKDHLGQGIALVKVHSQGWQSQAALTFSRHAASYAERQPNPPSHQTRTHRR
jgi:hypothetical protein